MATSGNTLLRNIGASVGTAAIGTIFATRAGQPPRRRLPERARRIAARPRHLSGDAVAKLPPARSWPPCWMPLPASLDRAFLVAAVDLDHCLRRLVVHQGIADAYDDRSRGPRQRLRPPRPPDSLAEVMRSLAVLIGRPQDAGLAATGQPWTPGRHAAGRLLGARAAAPRSVPRSSTNSPVVTRWRRRRSKARRLISGSWVGVGRSGAIADPAGEQLAARMIDAVRTRLSVMLDGWQPEQYADLARTLDLFAADFTPDRQELRDRGRAPVNA